MKDTRKKYSVSTNTKMGPCEYKIDEFLLTCAPTPTPVPSHLRLIVASRLFPPPFSYAIK